MPITSGTGTSGGVLEAGALSEGLTVGCTFTAEDGEPAGSEDGEPAGAEDGELPPGRKMW